MKLLLILTAIIERATGLWLFLIPHAVSQLPNRVRHLARLGTDECCYRNSSYDRFADEHEHKRSPYVFEVFRNFP